jgi:hypothetical protein
MNYEMRTVGVVLSLPDGCDVSDDGSVVGPDGLDFAVFAEPAFDQPLATRREIAGGRSYVDAFTHEEITPDGWLLLFSTEDGELGFELGRKAVRRFSTPQRDNSPSWVCDTACAPPFPRLVPFANRPVNNPG